MSLIERINEHLNIDEVLSFLPELQQQGANYVGQCPTGHESKSGTSFQVDSTKSSFHCFNCGIKGNYIHLIELVTFGECSSGGGGTETFRKTLKLLADRYGLNDDRESSGKESVFTIIDWVVSHYHRQIKKTPILSKVADRYGLSEKFLMAERWGYGGECPSLEMREFWTLDEILSTGLFNRSKKTKSGAFHIYQDRIVIPYNDAGRVTYTIGRRTGKTKGINGTPAPKYFKQYIHSEKRPFVSESIKNEIVKYRRDKKEVLITEGITDYLVAKMNGLNAVSAVTTSFKKDEFEAVVKFCSQFETVYIANDTDENEAGQKGADRIAKMLLKAGINPRIITLPLGEDQTDTDFVDYVKRCGIDGYSELKKSAPTYIQHLINQVDEDIDREHLMRELEPILHLMRGLPHSSIEIYIMDKIRNKFKLTSMKTTLQSMMDIALSAQPELEAQTDQDVMEIFKKHSQNITLISSGQDYTGGTLYYTITRPEAVTDKNGVVKMINRVFIVTSKRAFFEVTDYQIISDNFALQRKLGPEYRCEEWSFNTGKYSVENFVSGKVDINPAEVYKRVEEFISRHVYFKEKYESPFCAMIPMVSAVVMIFNAVGYPHLWAEKRSGKTTLMECLQLLGFNARLSSSISDAALFRTVEAFRPLLLTDEAENLNPSQKQRESGQSEKLELLKSGYKKSGSATRCEGQTHSIVNFHNYCLKVFAGTKTADPILADRMIMIEMRRATEETELEELIEARVKEEAQEIKDMIYCLAMQFASAIDDIYVNELEARKKILKDHKVTFRQKELWSPYLSMAILVDRFEPELGVFDMLLKKAYTGVKTQETFSSDSKSMEIIERLYLWIKKRKNEPVLGHNYDDNIFFRKNITNDFIRTHLNSEENEDDFYWVNYQNLKNMLRKYDIIDNESEIKRHQRLDERGAAIHLDPKRILESLRIYKNTIDDEVLKDIEEVTGKKMVEDKGYNFEDMGVE